MKRRIRVALIGAGGIFKAHARGFLKAGGRCEIAAVVKEHPERAEHQEHPERTEHQERTASPFLHQKTLTRM